MPGGKGGMCVLWCPGGLGSAVSPHPLPTAHLCTPQLHPARIHDSQLRRNPKARLHLGLQNPTSAARAQEQHGPGFILAPGGGGGVGYRIHHPPRQLGVPVPPKMGRVCAPGRFVTPPRPRGPSAQWGTGFTPFACSIRIIVQLIMYANESWPSPTKKYSLFN